MARMIIQMVRLLPRVLLLVLLGAFVALAAPAARASEPSTAEARRAAYAAAMERGAERMAAAQGARGASRRAYARAALRSFRLAAELVPTEAAPHYHAGLVYSDLLDESGPAVAAWQKAQAIDPAFVHDADMSFKLGIELSRLGRFGEAIEAYDRAASYRSEVGRLDIVLGNSAEAAMGAGRLDEAVRRYRLALATPGGEPSSRALHLFGLAVALDRDEQLAASREVMQRAVDLDPKRSSMRSERGVFFVPKGDRHYYDALAYLAQQRMPEARRSLERFLAVLPQDQFAPRARAHLAALARDPRSRPKPVPTTTRITALSVGWSLNRRVVAPRLRRRAATLRSCRPRANALDLPLRATATFTVTQRGRPTGIYVAGPDRRLNRCIETHLRRWRVTPPAHPGSTRIRISLELTARAGR